MFELPFKLGCDWLRQDGVFSSPLYYEDYSNELMCDFIAAFLTPAFIGSASVCPGRRYGFIFSRNFNCWCRNVVVASSLIYQMFIVTLSLWRHEPLLMCIPPGKSSDDYKPMVSTTLLSCCFALAFVFCYEFSILYGLILIKLSSPFLSSSCAGGGFERLAKSLQIHICCL